MYITRDMTTEQKRRSDTKSAPVKLSSVRPKAKPVRVVQLRGGDPVRKAADLAWIRKLDRAGLTEHNSETVAKLKRDYFRRYGERV